MLYTTIVQRNETGLNQILEAVCSFERENIMEAIIDCKLGYRELEKILYLVRSYQNRLNVESLELVVASERFIEQYATDHNECFRMAERVLRQIRTTVTGSMKIFRKFCPRFHHKYDERGRVVPALDYSRLTFRNYYNMLFADEVCDNLTRTLVHELVTFFYHLLTTLKICRDMIRKEEQVRGDFSRLKEIYENSCDDVFKSLREVYDAGGQVKIVSEKELAERRKNARPMKDWLAEDYHAHDKNWMMREAFFYRLASGEKYGLDEKACVLWAHNPKWGRKVCDLIPQLDTLNLSYKNSNKASKQEKKGTFDADEMVYLLKWSGVSKVSSDGVTVINEANEKQFYLYLQEHYKGDYLLPTWPAVSHARKCLRNAGVTMGQMIDKFASHIPQKGVAA